MIKRTFLLLLVLLSLSSCIGIESQIRFRRDGSGTLTFTYTVSQMIKELDTSGSANPLPLPVTKEDFHRAAEGVEGLKLRQVNQREDEENLYIDASLDFERVEAVNEIGNQDQASMSLTKKDGFTTFQQVVFSKPEGQEVSADSLQMVETFFQDYELSFVVETPVSIKEYSLGELSPDKRRLTYRVSVPELLRSAEDKILIVKW